MSSENSTKNQCGMRRIGIVAFPDTQILDIAGSLAVFTEAARIIEKKSGMGRPAHQVELISVAEDRMKLAREARMSPRNFARVFRQELSLTPARFVLQLRVETARRRLEESSQPVERIAEDCGFGSTESMRNAFQRLLRVSPQAWVRLRKPRPTESRMAISRRIINTICG